MYLAAVGARLPFGLGLVGLHRKLGAFAYRVGEEAPYAFAPPATGLEIFASGDMSTALGVPLTS